MPAPHARLQALIDQCVSRCAQVTQLPASHTSSSQSHTRTAHSETAGALRRAAESNDVELTIAAQATATGDGSVLDSSSGASIANGSSSALATSDSFAAHSHMCSTLSFEQYAAILRSIYFQNQEIQ